MAGLRGQGIATPRCSDYPNLAVDSPIVMSASKPIPALQNRSNEWEEYVGTCRLLYAKQRPFGDGTTALESWVGLRSVG